MDDKGNLKFSVEPEIVPASVEAREVLKAVDRLLKPQGVQVLLLGDKPENERISFIIGRSEAATREAEAGVDPNDAVLALLRDLEPEPASRKVPEVHLDDDPFGSSAAFRALLTPLPAPGAPVAYDGRTLAVILSSVDGMVGSWREQISGALSTIHNEDMSVLRADRYVLRAGQRFREMVLAHPDVAKAPYGKVAFNAASGAFAILGDRNNPANTSTK